MRVRSLISVLLVCLLPACSQSWEDLMPSADPGGMGLTADGTIAEGPAAVSSISNAQASNREGTVAPFGFSGETASYEFMSGYRVGAGDRLAIRIAGQTDLTGNYVVDASGNISMPLIHTTRVAGMPSRQIEKLIASKLRAGYLRDPSVSVQVTNLRPFFILGEVRQAGGFPYQAGMTVQNAVALGGGYAARADQGNVLLTRKSSDGTKTYRVPVTTQIYPGDIVFVRERWF